MNGPGLSIDDIIAASAPQQNAQGGAQANASAKPPGLSIDDIIQASAPSSNMTDDQIMSTLGRYGLANDPAVQKMIQNYGAKSAWDALHSKTPSQMLIDSGSQATYDEMPWYQRAAVNVGHGMQDVMHAAGGSALTLGHAVGLVGTDALNNYRNAYAEQQAANANAEMAVAREHPASTFWGQWAGQTLPLVPTMMVGGAAGAGRSLLARTGIGALEGSLYGGMTPTADQQFGRNMVLGGALGAAAPWAIKGLGQAVGFVGSHAGNLANLLRPGAARQIAGGVINDLTGGNIPATNPDQYVPNFKPTLSMVTRSPQVAAVENALVGKSLNDPIIAQRSANNVAATQALNSIRPVEAPGAASTRAVDALQSQYDASLAAKNAAYGRIDPENQFAVPFMGARNQIGSYLGSLTPTSESLIPSTVRPVMQIPNMAPVRDLVSGSLDVGQDAQAARVAGNARGAKVAGKVKSVIDNLLQQPDLRLNNPGFGSLGGAYPKVDPTAFAQRVQDASDLAQAHYGRFGNNVIQPALQRFESVPAKVDPTLALNKILSDGSPEDVARLDQALGNSQEGRQAVMSWLTNTLNDKAQLAAQDMEGNPMLSASKVANILDTREPLLQRFATPDQYGLLQRFRRSLQDNAYPANVKGLYGNSATAPLINTGNTLFDRASKMLGGGSGGTEAGAAIGSALGHAPGAAVGAKVGGLVDKALGKALEGRVRNVYELLSNAMADPELASSLMQDASAPKAPGAVSKIAQRLSASPSALVAKRVATAQMIRPFAIGPSLPGSPFGAQQGR